MKVSINSFVSLCSIYFLTMGLAWSDSAGVHINESSCGMASEFYGDPEVPVNEWYTSGVAHEVSTSSSNGNINITCSQDLGRLTSTGRSVIFNFDNTGVECTAMGYPTQDWHQVISRNGKAKMTCHYQSDD